jgi:hypothetical protein
MIRHFYCIAFITLLFGLSALAQPKPAEPQGPPPLPTMDDLHQMYDNADYQAAVQQIARVLRLRGQAAQPYDRDALLLLRGKTLLALDDPRAAKRAFDEAQKSQQSDIAMTAHGYVTLLNRSKLSVYTKRSGDKAQISIADPKNQVEAFAALLDDELPAFQKEAAAAAKADNLNPAIALVPKMLDLAGVDFAATGKCERIEPIAKEVGARARELIQNELTAQEQKISAIERMADQLIDTGGVAGRGTRRGGGWWNGGVTRRGLVSNEREDLYQLVEYLQKVEDTAKRGQSVAHAVKGETAAWDALVQQAGASEESRAVRTGSRRRAHRDGHDHESINAYNLRMQDVFPHPRFRDHQSPVCRHG